MWAGKQRSNTQTLGLGWRKNHRDRPRAMSSVHAYCLTYKVLDSKTSSSSAEDTRLQVSNTVSRQSLSCSHHAQRSAIQLLAWVPWAPSVWFGCAAANIPRGCEVCKPILEQKSRRGIAIHSLYQSCLGSSCLIMCHGAVLFCSCGHTTNTHCDSSKDFLKALNAPEENMWCDFSMWQKKICPCLKRSRFF